MSIQDKAKEIAEKAKLAAEDVTKKAKVAAEDVTKKLKEVDVDKIKGDVTGEDGKVSLDSIKALDNKSKAIGAGALAFVLLVLVMLFSGGGRSYSLDTLSEPYPATGSITERCERYVYLKYDYFHLINDGVAPKDIQAALDISVERVDKSALRTMTVMEKKYYKELFGTRRHAEKLNENEAGTIKDRDLEFPQYEKAIANCVKADLK